MDHSRAPSLPAHFHSLSCLPSIFIVTYMNEAPGPPIPRTEESLSRPNLEEERIPIEEKLRPGSPPPKSKRRGPGRKSSLMHLRPCAQETLDPWLTSANVILSEARHLYNRLQEELSKLPIKPPTSNFCLDEAVHLAGPVDETLLPSLSVCELRPSLLGLFAMVHISPGKLLTEFRGNLRLLKTLQKQERPVLQTFVLFPHAPRMDAWWRMDGDLTLLVLDAREAGSQARWVRRSCRPNVVVKPVYIREIQEVRWFLVSENVIAPGEELFLPLDFGEQYNDGHFRYDCACGQPEFCLSSMAPVLPPRKTTKTASVAFNVANTNGTDSTDATSRKPLSREERKLQQLIEFFERMDSQDKKREKKSGESSVQRRSGTSSREPVISPKSGRRKSGNEGNTAASRRTVEETSEKQRPLMLHISPQKQRKHVTVAAKKPVAKRKQPEKEEDEDDLFSADEEPAAEMKKEVLVEQPSVTFEEEDELDMTVDDSSILMAESASTQKFDDARSEAVAKSSVAGFKRTSPEKVPSKRRKKAEEELKRVAKVESPPPEFSSYVSRASTPNETNISEPQPAPVLDRYARVSRQFSVSSEIVQRKSVTIDSKTLHPDSESPKQQDQTRGSEQQSNRYQRFAVPQSVQQTVQVPEEVRAHRFDQRPPSMQQRVTPPALPPQETNSAPQPYQDQYGRVLRKEQPRHPTEHYPQQNAVYERRYTEEYDQVGVSKANAGYYGTGVRERKYSEYAARQDYYPPHIQRDHQYTQRPSARYDDYSYVPGTVARPVPPPPEEPAEPGQISPPRHHQESAASSNHHQPYPYYVRTSEYYEQPSRRSTDHPYWHYDANGRPYEYHPDEYSRLPPSSTSAPGRRPGDPPPSRNPHHYYYHHPS